MLIGIPKEIHPGEKRVATTPETAEKLRALGYEIALESGAGAAANYSDDTYREAGVSIVSSAKELWEKADIIMKVRAPEANTELGVHESDLLDSNKTLVSFVAAGINPDLLETLSKTGGTALAMDSIPRISRAQKMDALSSMANIA